MATAEQTLEELIADLERVASDFPGDMSEPLAECKQLFRDNVQANFEASATAGGEAWAPRKDKLPHPLLIKSGALLGSAVGYGSGSVDVTDADGFEIGTDLPYAEFLQKGTSRMPAREFEGVSDQTADKCADVVADHLLGRLS